VGINDEAFVEFVAGELANLLSFGHRLTADPVAADGLVQQALLHSRRRWRNVEPGEPTGDDVRRIMVRRQWSRRRPAAGRTRPPASPEIVRTAEEIHVIQALRALTARQRVVLVLCTGDGLSDAAVATVIGCREATVRRLRARALETVAILIDSPDISIEVVVE
jgi:RNA polymerase sigma factor (sigma-70 family)